MSAQVVAVVLAAGQGARMGAGKNKILLHIGNASVLEHTIHAIVRSECFDGLYIVCRKDERGLISRMMRRHMPHVGYKLVNGGETRQESVKNALTAIDGSASYIAVHDAARCFATPQLIQDCVESAKKYGSGVAGKRAVDTIKLIRDERIVGTLDRANIALIETPQVFAADTLTEAYDKAQSDGFLGTDDASLVERLGITPRLVESREENIKLTHSKDLALGEYLMNQTTVMRVGQGIDFHAFAEGRRLVLGGVDIPYEKGLLGHSDADVLIHAIMDALLGAAALGDIGRHFPDSDPAYKDISSMVLLERTADLLESRDCSILNIDATVIMQAPKIAPYIDRMAANIAGALRTEPSRISIKATTTEKLGFAGRGEGASAMAIAMIASKET